MTEMAAGTVRAWLRLLVAFFIYSRLRALFLTDASQRECSGLRQRLNCRPLFLSNVGTTVGYAVASSATRPKSPHLTSARPHVVWLLLAGGDISLNPGPRHPCPRCARAVKGNTAALQCDKCQLWVHRKCEYLPLSAYRRLSSSPEEWYCGTCQLPRFEDELFVTVAQQLPRSSLIYYTSEPTNK
ncbi:uncharacterized protein ISCGN_026756 [Ixodes scapularis]